VLFIIIIKINIKKIFHPCGIDTKEKWSSIIQLTLSQFVIARSLGPSFSSSMALKTSDFIMLSSRRVKFLLLQNNVCLSGSLLPRIRGLHFGGIDLSCATLSCIMFRRLSLNSGSGSHMIYCQNFFLTIWITGWRSHPSVITF
jgi:hypothetical protein